MKTPSINMSIRQSKKWVQFEDPMDHEFDQLARNRQDFDIFDDVFLKERHDSGDRYAEFLIAHNF